MAIELGKVGKLVGGALNGKKLQEAWLNGKKVWPVAGISTLLNLRPTVYLPLSGDIDDYSGNGNNPEATIGGQMDYYTAGFNNGTCLDLIDGGKAMRLPDVVEGTQSFTISICAFSMGTQNTKYDGIMGGVINGKGTLGLGYAMGLDAVGSPTEVEMRFQAYNGNSNQVCKASASNWMVNGWNHLIVVFDWPSRTFDFYLNGKKYGLMTPDEYPLGGPVDYSSRSNTWDGHIWLGRAFQTTTPPLDYWNGYLQEYAYFSRALVGMELQILHRLYKGNMIPSTSKSPAIDSWGPTIPYVCTGGTGTTENNIVPNMDKASETNKITISKANSSYLYFSRSMSKDVGVTDDLGGYSLDCYVVVLGIKITVPTANWGKSIVNNLDGSGCYLPINLSIVPPNVDATFTFTFQGVTQTFGARITA